MKKMYYYFISGLFFLALFSPLFLGFMDKKLALNGVWEEENYSEVTWKGILNGEAQSGFEKYVHLHLPGKPFFIRFRNEIIFTVFHTSPNENYVINKKKDIFSKENLRDFRYGSPVTDDYIKESIEKLNRLEELMRQKGKRMFLFLTPCKIRYRDKTDIPYIYRLQEPEQSMGSYDKLVEALAQSDLSYFDSVDYLNHTALDARVPFFYRTGYHWSSYVGNCVGMGFGEFIKQKTGFCLPSVSVTAEPCGNPVFPDADCFDNFNILSSSYEAYYKTVITVEEEGRDAPGFLCRGGSFMGQSLSMLIQNQYFGKNVHIENTNLFLDCYKDVSQFSDYDQIDLAGLFKDIDIVVLEINETAIHKMSFGFIDYLLENPEVISE